MQTIGALARARARKEQADHVVKALRAAWEAEHAAHLAEQRAAGEMLVAAECDVRNEAFAAFERDGTRKFDGCEVKMFATIDYEDTAALEWAKGSGMCLTLDKKAFEKVAKATDLPFVTKGEEPRVTISGDLTPFLAPTE